MEIFLLLMDFLRKAWWLYGYENYYKDDAVALFV